ncbi:bifunctional ADP-dependent NAD(P)H-hydrate dehydratase/NAD(P)H-hydrate epimerase [Niveispirillum irakense]|uniref:bifunctional ADP-dependent NAD(P)H-hydrate dehydratase/NAD(P)H-hydrate epimerase n=1 Tax=Niveispirillum irakense TaxID=34011 RepID=UPI0003F5A341|nr:bifunctional ADP-dependent NAD(P)H-hydrate dehydratase/NAD(P)H-hydrate epimerase [Niveispirillum irakense]
MALLTVAQSYAADRAAMMAGIDGTVLMARAGAAVAEAARQMAKAAGDGSILVLCGPGNNGGDGFVAARLLAEQGWSVRVGLLGKREELRGDAAWAAAAWTGPVLQAHPDLIADDILIIDALFGAGLNRDLAGTALDLVNAMAASGRLILAVDIPSGVNGDDGTVRGAAAPATRTISFVRRKPGHLLLPGRALCGRVDIADIGIPESLVAGLGLTHWANGPEVWQHLFPWPRLDGHKYGRGHLLMLGGAHMTGAGRLAARSALRIGAGLVTLACEPAASLVYSLALASLIVIPVETGSDFRNLLSDPRRNALLLGPGAGTEGSAADILRESTLAALAAGRRGVLDADIFSVFAGRLETLCDAGLSTDWVLTPHEGEFRRLFGDLPGGRLARAQAAARQAGAVLLLKGPDTVIAHPDGRVVINENAPPDLATAGSGDVLSGLIAGLLAQGMPTFEAAAAAAWIHGESGHRAGPGLIADDLPEQIPAILRQLKSATLS